MKESVGGKKTPLKSFVDQKIILFCIHDRNFQYRVRSELLLESLAELHLASGNWYRIPSFRKKNWRGSLFHSFYSAINVCFQTGPAHICLWRMSYKCSTWFRFGKRTGQSICSKTLNYFWEYICTLLRFLLKC